MTDTLSVRARRALVALGITRPDVLATVTRAQLLELPNCGPGTIAEIAQWGGKHAAHLVPNPDAPHRAPTSPTSADDRRAAPIVKVCPPGELERAAWARCAEADGLSLSRWLSNLALEEVWRRYGCVPSDPANAPLVVGSGRSPDST